MTKISRTSSSSSISSCGDNVLSTRTRKSISKSRRSSSYAVTDEKPSSRRSSLAAAFTLFEEETSPMMNDFLEIHTLYKTKFDRSSRKLNCFFGQVPPMDICIEEIIKEGLKAILESKVPLCYFLYFLLDEFCAENLFFFLDVAKFEKLFTKQNQSILEQQIEGKRIYEKYISSTASLEINLEDTVKRNITSKITACHNEEEFATLFNQAKSSVYLLLEASYIQFIHTEPFIAMVQNCGEFTIHYNDTITGIALNYLLNHLKKQKATMPMMDTNLALSKMKFHELTKCLLMDFVNTAFGINNMTSKLWADMS